MAEKRSVVIIGAGIGGITTAAYLSGEGYNVKIFEKNSSPGGRCGQLIRDGHRFDLGATMLLMPGIYRKIFDSLDIPFNTGEDIIPLSELYRIYFEDNNEISFTTDRDLMKKQLEDIEPGSFSKAEKYINEGYKIFRLGMNRLIGRNFYNLFQMVNFRNTGLLFRLRIFISNWKYAKKFFRHPHLLMAYTFQNIYVGQSPFNSPALFSMVPAAEFTEGSFFPKGGMYAIVEKIIYAAKSRGTEFFFDTSVSVIETGKNEVQAVILENGTRVEADIVIANADLPYVYRKLLPRNNKSAHLEKLNYSCSAICFHWGLDKIYSCLGHHSVFLSDSFREGLDDIFIGKSVNKNPSFYVHAPARTDPGSAPPGQESLSIVVAAGHLDKLKKQDWEKLRQETRDSVIRRLKKHGMDDIEEHIKFDICFTPENWESVCNISKGSVFGSLGHNILQMGYFRPHNRHDRYKNLYFVGGSTHPGNGIPNVLLSAKLVSERILLENK